LISWPGTKRRKQAPLFARAVNASMSASIDAPIDASIDASLNT
jgi:hypothetical protein